MAHSYVDMFDDDSMLSDLSHPSFNGIRLPDGRAFAWAEYGSPRGIPCILLPDSGSSRLSPNWLLHDSALPSSVRLLAVDRPGVGHSDPVGLGGHVDATDDLRAMVQTLAVGRVAIVGIGDGADDALAFAARYPSLVSGVSAVAVRLHEAPAPRRGWRGLFGGAAPAAPESAIQGWMQALGPAADPTDQTPWERSLDRMTAAHRALLAEQWREDDFRAAVAADAGEDGRDWSGIGHTASRHTWIDDEVLAGTEVHFWHGQQEGRTTVSELRTLAASRPGWSVSAVTSSSAVLGCWPQILSTAAGAFAHA